MKTAKQNTSVTKILNRSVIFIAIAALLISGIGCGKKATTPAAATQVATVRPGNLTISVSVDGNLVMPQAFDLLFGAPGDVKDVLVEEGDFVTEGTILARLDDTAQRLDVQSSNNSVQTVLSNLYEVVPLLPQFPISGPNNSSGVGYPFYYPNATALSSFSWAQDEFNRARELFQTDNYTAATSELYVALSDLEACIKILEDTINNPKSGLGNTAPFVPTDLLGITYFQIQQEQSFESVYIVQLRKVVDTIRQGQADIETVRGLMAQGKYDEASPMIAPLLKQVSNIGKTVIQNINVISSHNYSTVYGEDISLYFYEAAEDKLNAALQGIEKDGLDSPELRDNLRIAQHYMQICNSILGSNHYVLQHGLSLKAEQQYHVDLAKALVTLGNSKDNFLKTAILAPFDGTVVSIGVKKNDVLSAIDYASKVAVQLVDTSQIKFQGLVDEIDILKIKTGQKATVSVDAVPDKTFTGTVSFISPFGTPDTNNVVKFPVTILLDPTDVALRGGLTATADISIYSVENVLLVSLSAVTTTSAGSFVTVVDDATGKQEKREVTLGSKNLQFAEVVSGLKAGDKVIIVETANAAPIVKGLPRGAGPPPPSR